MANHPPPVLLTLAVSLLVLLGGSLTAAEDNQRQRQRSQPFRGREQDECQVSRLNSLEPTNRIQCEAGVIESWDANEDEFRCAGVAVVRHVIEPNGLLLPSFTNAPQLIYVVQGRGIQGVILPGCPETFQSSQQSQFEFGGREEFGERGGQRGRRFQDQHQKILHFRQGDVLVLPNGAAHWVYNDGDRPLVAIVLLDTTSNLNQLDTNPRRFYLAGNPEDEHQSQGGERGRHSIRRAGGQGGQGGQGGACNNIFCGFDAQFLAEAFNVDLETARRLQSENDNRNNIVRVEGRLQVLRPQRRESEYEREGQSERERERYGSRPWERQREGQSERERERYGSRPWERQREGQSRPWERETERERYGLRPWERQREGQSRPWERETEREKYGFRPWERERYGQSRPWERETERERETYSRPSRGWETERERERYQRPSRRETEWERERETYRPRPRIGGRGGGCEDKLDQENGLEETICTMRLRENIADPGRADIYTPEAGRISTLNSHNLPILKWLQLSAQYGVLRNNAIMVPHWNVNSHCVMYVIRGRARVQVVDNNGQNVFDEDLQEGRILVVPQNFAVVKRAENEEFEWISFKTSDNAMINPLAGRTSVMRALPEEVIANAYQISREDAKRLKYSRKETTVFRATGAGSMIQRRAEA